MRIRCRELLVFSIALLAILATGLPALACIWIYGTSLDGKSTRVGGHIEELDQISPEKRIAEWTDKLELYQKRLETNPELKNRSNYAAALIHVGELKLGIQMLEEIERTDPGHYVTAANLGTAFELSGNNEKALEWISEGIKRNADSHYGTEWVHVKILEAKIAIAKDPDWLKSNSVLGLDFGLAPRPAMPNIALRNAEGKLRDATDITYGIAYQLHERLGFVKAPDAIVGALLFDLANLHALTSTVEIAAPIYDLALKFGVKDPQLLNARKEFLASVLKDKELRLAEAQAAQAKVHADRLAAYSGAGPASVNASTKVETSRTRRTVAIAVVIVCAVLASAGIIVLTIRQNRRAALRQAGKKKIVQSPAA